MYNDNMYEPDKILYVTSNSKHSEIDFSMKNNLKRMFLDFSRAIIDCCMMLNVMDKCALLVYLRDRLNIDELRGNKSSDISSAYKRVLAGFDKIRSHSDFKLLRFSKLNEISNVKPLFDLIYNEFTFLFENLFVHSNDVMRFIIVDRAKCNYVEEFGLFDYRMICVWRDIFYHYIKGLKCRLYKVTVDKFEYFYSECQLDRLICGEFIKDMQHPLNVTEMIYVFNLSFKQMTESLPYYINRSIPMSVYGVCDFKIWLLDFLLSNCAFIENLKENNENIQMDFNIKIHQMKDIENEDKRSFYMFDGFMYELYLKMLPSLDDLCEFEDDILHSIMLFNLINGRIFTKYHILGNNYDIE